MFCVSIGFVLHGVPIIGVIYQPLLDTTYSSLTGYGAWQDDDCKNGKGEVVKERKRLPLVNSPKAVLGKEAPKGCIFSCEWGRIGGM